MFALIQMLEADFTAHHAVIHFENHLESTRDAVPCIAAGRGDIGLLGRELWPSEDLEYKHLRGREPVALPLAMGSYDTPKATFALMVFVPRANPLHALMLSQLKRIFAATSQPIRVWGDLGCTGQWTHRPVHLYGFDIENDKARIFRSIVFGHHEGWNAALVQYRNAAGVDAGQRILDSVASDVDGIGISNVHYATPAVKALPLAVTAASLPIPPTRASVAAGNYPLTRKVFVVVDRATLGNPAVAAFLQYAFTRQGQRAAARQGVYPPLTPVQMRRARAALAAARSSP